MLAVFAVLAAGVAWLAARDLEQPGLYYDETLQAATAAAFLRGEEPLPLVGARQVELGGRWLPWMTQPYLGALKTQVLIPCLAVLGTDAVGLRATTLVWGLTGLLLFGLWAREIAGPRVALAGTALLAFDPSFLFSVRHDWGPFALGFVCRMGGLLLVTRGWRRRSTVNLAVGGLLLGLAVYHKLDAAAFLAGCGLALVAVAPRARWHELRERPGAATAALAGLAAGSAPILPALMNLARGGTLRGLAAGRRGVAKLDSWPAVLDGSYIHRVLQKGGRLEGLFSGPDTSAHDLFGFLLIASVLALGALLLRDARGPRRSQSSTHEVEAFSLLALLAVTVALLAMPGATLMHHVLNVYPLPHLVAALALGRLARSGMPWRRAASAALLALVVASAIRVDLKTSAFIDATGGRGWWSDALDRLAAELPPGTPVVTVDWGFAAPLRFAHPELAVEETTWRLASARPRERVVLEGDADHVYLVHGRDYDALGFGPQLLDAVRALPDDTVEIRTLRDRQGHTAFYAIRLLRPHRLVHARRGFSVEWRPTGRSQAPAPER